MSGRRGFLDEPGAPAASRGWREGAGEAGPISHAPGSAAAAARGRPGSLALSGLAGLALVAALLGLDLANFLAAQFGRGAWLGLLTLALVVPPLALLGWAGWREWQGYAALGAVERVQAALAGEDATAARGAAVAWLAAVASPLDAHRAVQAAPDAATVRALLHAGPLTRIEAEVAREGRAAAVEALALTAVSPWPGLDGALVAWRGMRLVRRVAELHGVRPGALGTLRLFRRIALDAGMVAAADVAVGAAAEALLQSPLAGGLAGGAAGSAVAARRMLTLAQATARACRPVQ